MSEPLIPSAAARRIREVASGLHSLALESAPEPIPHAWRVLIVALADVQVTAARLADDERRQGR